MLFIYCENASKFLFIHTIKTTMSHYILDTFRIYEVSSPKYWAYLFFARWYNDEIKWWKRTWLDFNNYHRSLNICYYTNVCLCFHICDDTFSAKNGEQRCTGNPQKFRTSVKKKEKKMFLVPLDKIVIPITNHEQVPGRSIGIVKSYIEYWIVRTIN